MKTPEAIAQECAEKIHDLELDAAVNSKFDRTKQEQIDDHARIIAAAIREAVEHELATINAERAETRDIRKEMIKAQDEVAKLRAEVEQYKQDFRDQEKRIGQASRELAQVTGDRNIKRELIVRLNSEATQLRADVERLKGKADECWGAANYRLKYLACLFRALGRPDDETIESNISNAAEQITQLRAALSVAEGALKEIKECAESIVRNMNEDIDPALRDNIWVITASCHAKVILQDLARIAALKT
jgi:small-conductance mechanosensitive channel